MRSDGIFIAIDVDDATVETVQPGGATRTIPIAEFHRLPGSTPHGACSVANACKGQAGFNQRSAQWSGRNLLER